MFHHGDSIYVYEQEVRYLAEEYWKYLAIPKRIIWATLALNATV